MDGEQPKTLVLGFDALDFRHLDAFADSLPNFSALRSNGVEAPLRSTFPPWTGSAWPSMYTGTDPSHHGVYSFFDYGHGYPDDAAIVTRNDVRSPAIWNYLTERDVPSITLNVPVTYPAESVDGVLIPGYLAPEGADGYPTGIRDELSDALGTEYSIYSKGELSDDKQRKLEGYVELVGERTRAAKHLLETNEWEVAVVQVQKTDAVFHNFDDPAAFRRVYRAADELVGELLSVVDDDVNVVVCSDHGIGETNGYQIRVNDVLRKHGFVETAPEATGASLASEKSALMGEDGDETDDGPTPTVRALSAANRLLGQFGVTPGDVYAVAERIGVGSQLVDLLPQSTGQAVGKGVDWRRSTAYCRSRSELGVRINLEGREPAGVVSDAEYEDVRTELIRVLSRLETPDGKPAFEFVKRREDVYDGPLADRAPDVVFMPTDMNNTVSTTLLGQSFLPLDGYDHKREGVFVGTGPAFDASADPGTLSLTDVAPIVMALSGSPVPTAMTGSVPNGVLSVPVTGDDYDGLQVETGVDDLSDGQVEARLEDLGYL